MSIQYTMPGFELLEQKSPPITTKPWLSPSFGELFSAKIGLVLASVTNRQLSILKAKNKLYIFG